MKRPMKIGLFHYKKKMNALLPHMYFGLKEEASALVGPACNGILEWLSNLFDFNKLLEVLFEDVSFSKSYINSKLAEDTLSSIRSTSIFIGAIIAICLFAMHMVLVNMNYASDSSQKQTMIDILIRTPIAFLLVLTVPSVIGIMDDIVNEVLSQAFFNPTFGDLVKDTASVSIEEVAGTVIKTGGELAASTVTFGAPVILDLIITLILFIAIIIEVIKLLIEIAERGIVLWVMDIFAPVAAGAYVSRTTSSIFTNFLRMYFSQSLLIVMNEFFLVVFYHMCANLMNLLLSMKYLILILAVLKTAQRIDSHLKALGLTVAQTGSLLLDSVGMAAHSLSSMVRGGTRAVGAAGSILAAKGAASGDMGMAIMGNNLSSFARGDYAGMGHEMGMARAQMRGIFKNAGLGNVATIQEAITEAKTGNYRPINQLSPEVKTEALKNAFGAEGINSILQQTGLDLNNAKNLTINPMNGDISGIVTAKDANGKDVDVAFKTSSTPMNASSKQVKGITGDCYITPMSQGKVAAGFRTEGTQLMSAITGVDLSSAEGSGLNITESSFESLDGHDYVMHYDGDHSVGLTDAKTGEFYSMGSNYNGDDYTVNKIKEDEIAEMDDDGDYTVIRADGPLGGYDFGNNAKIVNGSFVESEDDPSKCECEINSDSGSYQVFFQSPAHSSGDIATVINNRKKVHVEHLGKERGDIVCVAKKKA